VAALYAFPGCIIFEKLNRGTAFRTFCLEYRVMLPVSAVLSGALHKKSPLKPRLLHQLRGGAFSAFRQQVMPHTLQL